MVGDVGEAGADDDSTSKEYTLLVISRDSSRALASSSSSWAINSCSRCRASDAESVSARSISFSSGTVSEATGSGG